MIYHILVDDRPLCMLSREERQQVMDLCTRRGVHYPACSNCSLTQMQADAKLIRFALKVKVFIIAGVCPEDTRERLKANLIGDGIEGAL